MVANTGFAAVSSACEAVGGGTAFTRPVSGRAITGTLELDGVAQHEIGRPQSHGHDRQNRAERRVGLRVNLRAHQELDHG
jgi:hypothetical protein